MRAIQHSRGGSRRQGEPFNRCVFHVALSQPLSRAIDEGDSLSLTAPGLKGSSQGGVGAQQRPDTAAYQAGWQCCSLQPHGEQGRKVL